jgi:PPOX class probable F420-dependent enzyme
MAEFRFQLSAADTERVRAAPVARLATIRPDRTPHLVPITFAFDDEVLVTAVDGKPKRTTDLQRLRNLRTDPAVSVLIDCYDEDWTQLWWVRIDGVADVVDGGPDQVRAIEALTAKYPQYRDRPPAGAVIRVRPSRVATWHG